LWRPRRAPLVQAVDEAADLARYEHAMERLEAAGLGQYEISSFARAGERCRHNEVYWANEAYFGFGLGAARYVRQRREHNTRDLEMYLRRVLAGESASQHAETLEPEERARETAGLNLRRAEGIERSRFRRQTGFDIDALAGPVITRHVELGLLGDDGQSVRLTRRGKCVADAVIQQFM